MEMHKKWQNVSLLHQIHFCFQCSSSHLLTSYASSIHLWNIWRLQWLHCCIQKPIAKVIQLAVCCSHFALLSAPWRRRVGSLWSGIAVGFGNIPLINIMNMYIIWYTWCKLISLTSFFSILNCLLCYHRHTEMAHILRENPTTKKCSWQIDDEPATDG
jgi:hypothetical protein